MALTLSLLRSLSCRDQFIDLIGILILDGLTFRNFAVMIPHCDLSRAISQMRRNEGVIS